LQHPVTTEYPRGLEQIQATLRALDILRMPTIMLWPNADAGSDEIAKGIRQFREHKNPNYIHFYRNFSPEDFLVLMRHAACMIGNSSSAIREGAFLGTPAVNIGSRQQARERGRNVVDVDYDTEQIVSAVRRQVAMGRYPPDYLYGDGHAGERIAAILARLQPGEIPVQKVLYYPQFWEKRYRQSA